MPYSYKANALSQWMAAKVAMAAVNAAYFGQSLGVISRMDVGAALHRSVSQMQMVPWPYFSGIWWQPISNSSLSVINWAILLLKHPLWVSLLVTEKHGPRKSICQLIQHCNFFVLLELSTPLYEILLVSTTSYFAIKKSWFDFADELKVGDVRYKHLT